MEIIGIITIVSLALLFTGRAWRKTFKTNDQSGCGSSGGCQGCYGCSTSSNAGTNPATQIKVSGCSGMALAHSRRPSMSGSEASAANHTV